MNPTGTPDYMMEVESNLGATKANFFVTRQFTVQLTRRGSILHHKVTIVVTDNMPYVYRPMEYYRAYLRLYVSAAASSRSQNLNRPQYPESCPAQGYPAYRWLAAAHPRLRPLCSGRVHV